MRNTVDKKHPITPDGLFHHKYFVSPISPQFFLNIIILLLVFILGVSCRKSPSRSAPLKESQTSEEKISGERSLFDGKSLGRWAITDFGGQGRVYVKDGAIYMEMGNNMTGINWEGPLVRMNYEISLEAMRLRGNDFFCGLTFPVGENSCSLILGGWGGSLCGLSNIDSNDASSNETAKYVSFEDYKWYHVRLHVTPDRIEAWLDDEKLVSIEITGRKIGIRSEVYLSRPLGIATWQTVGAVRDIRIRPL